MLVRHLALYLVLLRGVGGVDLNEPMRGGEPYLVIRLLQKLQIPRLGVVAGTARFVEQRLALDRVQRIPHGFERFDHRRAHLVGDDLPLRQHVTPDLLLERVRLRRDEAADLLYVDP